MEKMNKIVLVLLIVLFVLIGVLVFIFVGQNFTGRVILETESLTTAICNGTNSCQDYEVICQNGQVSNITPITGAAVQYSPRWDDPRNETDIEKLC